MRRRAVSNSYYWQRIAHSAKRSVLITLPHNLNNTRILISSFMILTKNPRRAPIKRQRSTSHPPTQPPPGDHSCRHPPLQKPPTPAQLPPPEPDHHEEAPPTADQEAQPKQTSRSGRPLLRPSALGYLANFAQQDSREPSPKFRLPGPVAPNPPKPYHGPTTDV